MGRGEGGREGARRSRWEVWENLKEIVCCSEGVTEGIEWLANRVQQTLERRGKTV
jgi:hypothetical protein